MNYETIIDLYVTFLQIVENFFQELHKEASENTQLSRAF